MNNKHTKALVHSAIDELYHYGILGMKWGVRRYQPYPSDYKGDGKYTGKESSKSPGSMSSRGFHLESTTDGPAYFKTTWIGDNKVDVEVAADQLRKRTIMTKGKDGRTSFTERDTTPEERKALEGKVAKIDAMFERDAEKIAERLADRLVEEVRTFGPDGSGYLEDGETLKDLHDSAKKSINYIRIVPSITQDNKAVATLHVDMFNFPKTSGGSRFLHEGEVDENGRVRYITFDD